MSTPSCVRVVRSPWPTVWVLLVVTLGVLAGTPVLSATPKPQQAGAPAAQVVRPSDVEPLRPGQLLLVLDPSTTRVDFKVGATFHHGGIHGTSHLVSGEVRFNPQAQTASGELVVNAASTSTRKDKRDRHMHEDVLETDAYPSIVFVPTGFQGEFHRDAASDVDLVGHLDIHGAEHPITLHAHVVSEGDQIHGTAQFEVPYVEWGMKNPSKFLLKVSKTVQVQLQFSGNLMSADTQLTGYQRR